ncbi:phosphopantetheine-binding protein [Streptomyces decoyicus]|uniref:phosphopantetheine-binding protein n=1 Tax=Streptomyces decoyicus TaxID=249567 RepID=UPI0033A1C446
MASERPIDHADYEITLCEMFADLLECDAVATDDDFFVLGGHSLLATRLVNRIAAELNADIALKTVFENPTVAELAERLSEGRRPVGLPALRPHRPALTPAPPEKGEPG